MALERPPRGGGGLQFNGIALMCAFDNALSAAEAVECPAAPLSKKTYIVKAN